MRSILKKVYFFNLDKVQTYNNDQKRIHRLRIINYFLVFSVPVIIISDLILLITGVQPYTFEKYPVVIFWFFSLLALFLTTRRLYLPSKLIIIFSPLLFITSYSLTGYIIGEHFLWQPILVLGMSVIPFLVLDLKKEWFWLLISFLSFFIYIIFHDKIMLFGSDETFSRVFIRLNTTPFIYNAVRILIFLFLTFIIYYSVRLNDHQQIVNEQINESLIRTSRYLERVNAELEAGRNAIDNSASLLLTDELQNITSVNNNFLSLSEYAEEELVGKNLGELISSYYDQPFYNSILQVLYSGEVWRGELKFRQKGGDYFWMQSAISVIYDADKKQRGFMAIMFNITSLKNHEERLERLNHEKDRILYAVAHDLKNPLLNFKALLDLIKSGAVSKKEEEEIFRLMTRDCEHSTNLIAELLEIGRLEDEKFVLKKAAIDLHQFLDKSIEQFEQKATKKDIRFTKVFDDQLTSIDINEKEFVRVIYNLMSNAIKFTPEGGEIIITTKDLGRNKICIEISDTGVGISKDLLPIIFDKFSKAARTGVSGEKSTGLGMWIVKHIVELHGGEISVKSREEAGTTFTIILPK